MWYNVIIRKLQKGVKRMTIITKDRGSYIQEKEFDRERFKRFINEIYENTVNKELFTTEEINDIYESVVSTVESMKSVEAHRLFDYIVRESNDRVDLNNVKYTNLSASAYLRKLYKEASRNRGFDYRKGYGDYYPLVKRLVELGKYSEELLEAYSEEELRRIGKLIDPSKDKLFNISGLQILKLTYLNKADDGTVIELPQERFLTTIAYLMKDEPKELRYEYIKEAYWAVSNHYIGLATPTLKNSGTPHGSLSSCHIVTVDDNLESIFDTNKQIAKFSQEGSGIGVFLGFLRAGGSWIRGIKGVATGVIHPSRLLSVLAEYVNQTGTRKAGVAVYLPVWHGDIFDFLDLRLKTGSQEKRAHSIKTAVTIPDEFMRRLKNKEVFTIFDPYEVKKELGIDLNRLYDKRKLRDGEEPNKEDHAFTYYYRLAEKADLKLKRTVSAVDIYKSIFVSRKTGGTPYLYFSDTAARLNTNPHVGMPLGSNLC